MAQHKTDPAKSSDGAVFNTPFILHYRVLKTSVFFTLIWLFMAFLSFILIQTYHYKSNSIEFFTLLMSAAICLIMALHSLDTYGGPFLYFQEDHLKIRHSIIRKILIPYRDIQTINVVREEIEIVLHSGNSIMLNLAQLSFEDQAVCLKKLNMILAASLEE